METPNQGTAIWKSGAPPSPNWFRSPDFLESCIKAEIELLKVYQPDRVIMQAHRRLMRAEAPLMDCLICPRF